MNRYYKKSSGIKSIFTGVLAFMLCFGACSALYYLLPHEKTDSSEEDIIDVIPDDPIDSGEVTSQLNYYSFDLTTNVSGQEITSASQLNELFGLDDDVVGLPLKEFNDTDLQISKLYKDFGGIRFGSSSAVGGLTFQLREGFIFDYIVLTGFDYYREIYIDESNGITTPQYDEDGNKIVQSVVTDIPTINVSSTLGETENNTFINSGANFSTYETENEGQIDFGLAGFHDDFKISGGTESKGRFVLTKIELFKVVVQTTDLTSEVEVN